jgi:hypothetical protein
MEGGRKRGRERGSHDMRREGQDKESKIEDGKVRRMEEGGKR